MSLRRTLFAIAAALAAFAAPASQAPAAEASAPTRFSVVVEGKGPDVIFIPGLVSGRRVWDGAVQSLDGKYRVHRVQLAGFAGEPARGNAEGDILPGVVAELHEYIRAQGLKSPEVVGHSLGGLLALMLAAEHPHDVGALMVVDALPFYGLVFDPGATVEGVAPRAAQLRDMMIAMDDEAYKAQQPRTIATLVRDETARPAVLADSLASDRKVAARAVYEDMVTDMRPRLTAIEAPLTIVYAVNPFAPEAAVGTLYRTSYAAAPDATFEPVPDSHHFLMLDQPGRFAAILSTFLANGE